jgi:type II restriction enzyme
LNSLIGSSDIENEFDKIIAKYPETLMCIPILLAVRQSEILALEVSTEIHYDFSDSGSCTAEQYRTFMRKTGLFDLLEHHIVSDLVDYVTGVETGLDSNGRKNRGGHLMEDLVEDHLKAIGLQRDCDYFKEITIQQIQDKWGLDLSAISNNGHAVKRFDFALKSGNTVFGIETNFYASGGSKLNETARSYKTIALEAQTIPGFEFVWFTDGSGWHNARHNLEETFDIMENLYNINDLNNGVAKTLFA